MNEFRFAKLESVVSRVKVGFVGSVNKFYCHSSEEGSVPIIRTTDIEEMDYNKFKFVTREFHEKNIKSQLKKGDLIIARHGENGNAVVYDLANEAQVLNAVIIQPDPTKLEPDLLKIHFDSPFIKSQIKGSVKGSIQGVINTKHIADLILPINDSLDYKFIAELITQLDTKLELNNKINTELEAISKLMYDYWFVQFDFPDENGKPYKSSGGKMVYNDELKREIPEGWEVKELGDDIEIERGMSYKSSEIKGGGIPMINLNSFNLNGTYKKSGIKMYSGKYKDNKLAKSGDLLIAVTDVTRDAVIIGKPILVPEYYSELVYSMDVTKVIPSENLSNTYLMMLFKTDHYHNYIRWFASGTTVLHLNIDGMKWYKAEIPPKKLLNKYDSFHESIAKRISETTKQNQKLAELRDWLLPILMNGQVKVN
tara:strand:- start:76 stop:1350 length:1275 start_codon:yes stop_codon:yes gene_type:complete